MDGWCPPKKAMWRLADGGGHVSCDSVSSPVKWMVVVPKSPWAAVGINRLAARVRFCNSAWPPAGTQFVVWTVTSEA